MTLTNRDWAINVLRKWWNATPMVVIGFSTFQDAIRKYDVGNFLDQFGSTVRKLDQSKVDAAMQKLAAKYTHTYPDKLEFFNVLAVQVQAFTLDDAKDVAVQTVKDVGKVAAFGLGSGLTIAIVIGVAYLAVTSGMLSTRRARA